MYTVLDFFTHITNKPQKKLLVEHTLEPNSCSNWSSNSLELSEHVTD
jgi:hypothetical protein